MANRRYLDIDDGVAYIVERTESGQEVSRKVATAAEAFDLITKVVNEPEHYKVRGFGARGDPDVLKERIVDHVLRIIGIHAAEFQRQGKSEQELINSVRTLLRDPATLGYVKWFAENIPDQRGYETIARIWPRLVDPNLPLVDPTAPADPGATPADVAMAGGSNQGTAPLPQSKPGGSGSGKVPPSGKQGSATGTGGGMTPDGARAADPVLPASGQLLIEDTDLEVEGIGLDFRFDRCYLHNVDYEGPLGLKWDHSYNLWLREAVEPLPNGGFGYVVYRSSGRLEADRFTFEGDLAAPEDFVAVSDGVFAAPDGTHERLVKVGNRFVLESPDGHRIFYNEHLRAERLQDLNGNRIALRYQNDAFRLSEIVDTCGRVYLLAYGEAGRLVSILDTALGREISYAYDPEGRLIAVRHSTGDPGKPHRFKGYRYWGDGAPPGMSHNIVAVVDPRGVDVLQVRYGVEPGLPSFNRVVEQRNGNILNIDYEFLFEAGTQSTEMAFTEPAVRLRMRDSDGGKHELDYNSQGRMIRHTVFEFGLAGTFPLETRWNHNADGRVIREERPSGAVTEYQYGRERFAELGGDPSAATAAERMTFGNLCKVVEHARPGIPGPLQRITEFDHHPTFGFIVEQRGPYYADALGMRTGGGPSFTFRAAYDANANLVRLEYPDCTAPDGTVQSGRRIELDRDVRGRLVARRLPLDANNELSAAYEYPPDVDPSCSQASAEILDPAAINVRRSFSHDAAGRTTRVQESSGEVVSRQFDHLGRVLTEELSPGPAGGMPSRITTEWAPHDQPERIIQNLVDARGFEDPNGALEQTFAFDAEGEIAVARTRSADMRVDRESRHDQSGPGGRLARVSAAGVESRFIYNARGLLLEQVVSADGTEPARYRYQYDEDGLLVRIEDSEGRSEETRYDGFGRVARRTVGRTVDEYEWDAGDRLIHHTIRGPHPDRVGSVALREERRDLNEAGLVRGLRVGIFDPGSANSPLTWAETRSFYDRADRLVRIEGPAGDFRAFEYDGLGRPTRWSDASGNTESWSYDATTRTVAHEITLPAVGGSPQMSFRTLERTDQHDNVIERTDALGNTYRYEWDSRSNLVAVVDPGGIRRQELLEADGQLRRVVVAEGTPEQLVWEYRRDSFGQVIGIDGPRGQLVAIKRDSRGRAVEVNYGPTGTSEPTTYIYDSIDRIARSKDGRGLDVEYTYGPLGLPTRIVYDRSAVSAPAGAPDYEVTGPDEVRLDYDGAGGLIEADDGTISVVRRYDSRGLLLRESVDGTTVSWSYDIPGRVDAFTYPDGRRIRFDRDTGGRITRLLEDATSALDPGSPAPGGIILDRVPWGLMSALSETWRGVVERVEIPDGAGRQLRLTDRRVAGGNRIAESIQISDERGVPRVRQVGIDGNVLTEAITTDSQARVTRVARSSGIASANVSGLGPEVAVAQVDHTGAADALTANIAMPPQEEFVVGLAADGTRERLRRLSNGATVDDLTYLADAAGRIVAVDGVARRYDGEGVAILDSNRRYHHDVSRRLTRVVGGGATEFACTRDPLGRVHRISVNGTELRLVHDGARLVEVRNAAGPVMQLVRDFNTGFVIEIGQGGDSFLALRDLSGSVIGAADETGTVVSTRRYEPFGESDVMSGLSFQQEFGFQSLLSILRADAYLTRSRTYDPASGSFLEPDPADFIDGPNRYLAARGNAYLFRDEWGLSAQGTQNSGRGEGTGTHNQRSVGGAHAEDRELRWYERAFLSMAGAVGATVDMLIVEPAKQLTDIVGLGIAAFGVRTGWYEFDYEVKSGIGHAAAQGKGTIDIFKDMGRNIVDTPGRVWDAAESGDWYQFGAEAMNLYTIGKSVHGVARGTASWTFNRGVNALGGLGKKGLSLRWEIRTWQVNRLARKSMAILAKGSELPAVRYAPWLESYGSYSPAKGIVSIGESAFTPGLRGFWPRNLGGYQAFRLRVGNLLRGDVKLRTMVHEINHYNQHLNNPRTFLALDRASPDYLYGADPWEFTQFRGSPITGSWNLEMSVPAGPFSTGLGAASVGNNLIDTEGPRTNAP